MRWSYNSERSYGTALWLSVVALLVVCMVVVGGATRLTGSGLSITEWRPVTGALPPLSDAAWLSEFHKYQRIPQYQLVNRGLPLSAFKTLYWWEWGHRLLARLVGAAILAPLVLLLFLRRIPRRLVWRCCALLGLVALEGFIGWWMVASGLEARVSVAPERLATHLGIALIIFSTALWTALESWFGRVNRSRGLDRSRTVWTVALAVLAYVQILLGALVAGSHAGQIDTDWPLMAGRLLPEDYAPAGMSLWDVIAHNQASVQLHHRLTAYALVVIAAVTTYRCGFGRDVRPGLKLAAVLVVALVAMQAALGIATLRLGAPLWMALAHQIGAVAVLASTLVLAWRARRE